MGCRRRAGPRTGWQAGGAAGWVRAEGRASGLRGAKAPWQPQMRDFRTVQLPPLAKRLRRGGAILRFTGMIGRTWMVGVVRLEAPRVVKRARHGKKLGHVVL